jgi:hypothetical protein
MQRSSRQGDERPGVWKRRLPWQLYRTAPLIARLCSAYQRTAAPNYTPWMPDWSRSRHTCTRTHAIIRVA